VKEVLGLVSLVTVAPYQVGLTPTFNCCDIGVGEGNKPSQVENCWEKVHNNPGLGRPYCCSIGQTGSRTLSRVLNTVGLEDGTVSGMIAMKY
jgi:hypothetical protein